MRKEDAILKINKLGNAGNIIVRIAKIVVVLGMVLALVGALAVLVLPSNLITMEMGSTADITVDVTGLDATYDEDEKNSMLRGFLVGMDEDPEAIHDFHMNVNGSEYETVSTKMTDGGMFVQAEVEKYSIELGDFGIVCGLGLLTMAALMVTLVFAGKLCKAFRDCESPFEQKVVKQLNGLAYSLLPWVVLGSLTESVTESVFSNHYDIMVGIDLGMVLIIVVILALAYIFKYGAVLQQESDETL